MSVLHSDIFLANVIPSRSPQVFKMRLPQALNHSKKPSHDAVTKEFLDLGIMKIGQRNPIGGLASVHFMADKHWVRTSSKGLTFQKMHGLGGGGEIILFVNGYLFKFILHHGENDELQYITCKEGELGVIFRLFNNARYNVSLEYRTKAGSKQS